MVFAAQGCSNWTAGAIVPDLKIVELSWVQGLTGSLRV